MHCQGSGCFMPEAVATFWRWHFRTVVVFGRSTQLATVAELVRKCRWLRAVEKLRHQLVRLQEQDVRIFPKGLYQGSGFEVTLFSAQTHVSHCEWRSAEAAGNPGDEGPVPGIACFLYLRVVGELCGNGGKQESPVA